MGDNVEPCGEFIEKHAIEARSLDACEDRLYNKGNARVMD